jgi:carboxyvinyl-carboxyphosphonate phosphorylmutase
VTPTDRRTRFRHILAGTGCVHPADVFDPISARLAADLGFEAGMFAGSVAAMTVLGAPDLVVLTLTEFAEQARRIGRAADLPLMVDADHGYGNALSVKRTVEELETAGVAALTIEDTLLPAPYGGSDGKGLVSIAEGVGKMKAALAGRSDRELVIVGRTSALAISGVDDTIARITAYQAAGVDAIFLAGAKTRAEVDAVASVLTVPLILGGAAADLIDRDYLAARGVRICLLGQNAFLAAVQAMQSTMSLIRAGTPVKQLPNLAAGDLIKRVTRQADYARWGKEFLGS